VKTLIQGVKEQLDFTRLNIWQSLLNRVITAVNCLLGLFKQEAISLIRSKPEESLINSLDTLNKELENSQHDVSLSTSFAMH
jgi:hypothetical protein